MVGGRVLRMPLGLFLSTSQGVTFAPHDWFVPVTRRSDSRVPAPWPAKWNPSVHWRPSPGSSELNQPKNAPLEPAVAVRANVPEADILSLRVRVGIGVA